MRVVYGRALSAVEMDAGSKKLEVRRTEHVIIMHFVPPRATSPPSATVFKARTKAKTLLIDRRNAAQKSEKIN